MKIIILGNSLASSKFIAEVKKSHPQSEMVLFPFDEQRAVVRPEFLGLLAQQKSLDFASAGDARTSRKAGTS